LLVLGDVSGKAAPAALYAALVSGILRSLAPRHLPPARLLSVLNEQLQERKLDGQYVTMLLALWDDSTRTLCLANAGSVQPILVSSAGVSTINVEGFPLGLFPHATYDEMALPLASGDLVVFFSDGITDAVNATREQFGSGRLHALLEQLPATSGNAQSTVDAIVQAVAAHQAGAEHFDDETVIVLRAR